MMGVRLVDWMVVDWGAASEGAVGWGVAVGLEEEED
jgi:hypothetical protein